MTAGRFTVPFMVLLGALGAAASLGHCWVVVTRGGGVLASTLTPPFWPSSASCSDTSAQ